jgi:tetratricopeptide (TPR) repeat protein
LRLFEEEGFASRNDDPAALSLKGRLLKDQAALVRGDGRRLLYLEAAAAYGAAGKISGSTYPLINAATLALLAGDASQARERAASLLARIDATGDDPDETPYYAMATRAEALLLVGDTARARAALEAAVALAPRAWEDHASTLRQFALVLGELGEDAGWLEPLRPPRALHFGGGMGLAGPGAEQAIGDWLAKARVGFGYGALAAGADILIAEALVEAGAELHVVLPCPPDAFRRASVAPYGADWVGRFDALRERCDSLHVAGSACPEDDAPISPRSLQLAAEVAMGRAVMQAKVLATSAVQLLAVAEEADGPVRPGGSAWMGQAWREAGRDGEAIVLPAEDASGSAGETGGCTLAAVVSLQPAAGGLDAVLAERLAKAVQAVPGPAWPPRWSGASLAVAFESPRQAAASALAILASLGEAVRIGLAYDLAETPPDPFGGPALMLGPAMDRAVAAAASAPAGAAHATGDFVAALHAGPQAGCPRTEYVGDMLGSDLEDPIQLHALKPPAT